MLAPKDSSSTQEMVRLVSPASSVDETCVDTPESREGLVPFAKVTNALKELITMSDEEEDISNKVTNTTAGPGEVGNDVTCKPWLPSCLLTRVNACQDVQRQSLPSCFYECQGSYQGCCKASEL